MDVGQDDFHELKPFAPEHFHVGNVPWGDHVDIHFVAADAGKPSRLEQTFDGGKPQIYESVAAFDPTAAQMGEYPGSFVSQEIDPIYRISLQDGKLTLLRLKNKPDPLWPAMRDVFVGEIGTLRFTRDANHHISGFILDADRIQNFSSQGSTDTHHVPKESPSSMDVTTRQAVSADNCRYSRRVSCRSRIPGRRSRAKG